MLYKGGGEVRDEVGQKAVGLIEIAVRWLPSPRITFSVTGKGDPDVGLSQKASIHLDDGRDLSGAFSGMQITGDAPGKSTFEMRGRVTEGEFGSREHLKSVLFSIANFPGFSGTAITNSSGLGFWLGRLVWTSDDWRLTVDDVAHRGELTEALQEDGGYALTHVALLERIDGNEIDPAELDNALVAVSRFLSFVAGTIAGVVLPRGLERSGNFAWERWSTPPAENYHGRLSCFPRDIVEGKKYRVPELTPVFSRFLNSWDDPEWSELLRYGVAWYTTLHPHPSAETKIILAQAGLELITWTHFVPAKMNKTKYNNMHAADRLRQLLHEANVPLYIPPSCWPLEQYITNDLPPDQDWPDGPAAFTAVRNILIHPVKNLRPLDIPADALVAVARLGVWYLQLSLMYVFGYEDVYLSIANGWSTQPSPWTLSAPSIPPQAFPPLPKVDPAP